MLRVDSADTVLGLIERRDVDIGLTVQPPPDGRFAYQHLHDDEFVLVCRADDPLVTQTATDRPLGWEVFTRRRYIAAAPGSNARTATDSAFMKAGVTVRPSHEVASTNLPLIGGLVAAGLGISALPVSTLGCLNQPALVSRRLVRPRLNRRVGIVTLSGRTLSLATTGFCEHLAQQGAASAAASAAGGVRARRQRP
jgi:LysR family carnitine catabolism transcriptional activator